MDFTEALLRTVAQEVLGTTSIPYGEHVDRPRAAIRAADHHRGDPQVPPAIHRRPTSRTATSSCASSKALGIEPRAGAELGELQLTLFEETTEQLLIQPTYIVDYPAIVSPLARRNDANPEITDRFELYIAGREIANGFSELNDPEDQAARFQEQARAKAAGDEEAMYYDADYIRALEHGLPPTAGCGIGIDRLVMLFTNSPSIRDVILFPHLRPEA